MKSVRLQSGPVTLYAQLANILRDRIVSGIWKPGDDVPTLEQLVEEFSVARVTVRQAVQILTEEGMLSSQRGRRTFVTFEPQDPGSLPLYNSIGSIDSNARNFTIRLLSRDEFEGLPPHFSGPGVPVEKYMRIRKVDSQDGVAYAVSDSFVALSLYKRFPPDAERKMKLSRLVRDLSRPKLASGHERMTVTALDYEVAILLKAPIGSPAAQIARTFLTPSGKVAYFGTFIYRGDQFGIERDISDLLIDRPKKEIHPQ